MQRGTPPAVIEFYMNKYMFQPLYRYLGIDSESSVLFGHMMEKKTKYTRHHTMEPRLTETDKFLRRRGLPSAATEQEPRGCYSLRRILRMHGSTVFKIFRSAACSSKPSSTTQDPKFHGGRCIRTPHSSNGIGHFACLVLQRVYSP